MPLDSKYKFIESDIERSAFDTAVNYFDGDMLDDTVVMLQERYPASNTSGSSAESIQPLTVPLAERFLDEAANLYSTGVTRKLVNDEGEEDEEATEALNEHLDEIAFDQTKSQQERYIIGLKSCGIYYQENKQEQLNAQIYLPQDIIAVKDTSKAQGLIVDPANPDEYAGFVIAMRDPDLMKDGNDRYALITPTQIIQYTARIDQPDQANDIKVIENPYGVQTFSIWHMQKPVRNILPSATPSIYTANKELNILWSMLYDIIRFQGGGTLVKGLIDPEESGARAMSGVRFPANVSPEESVGYINSANDYTGIVGTLTTFMRLIALTHSLSPNDFSLEATSISSGFAKLIDSLPKIEARKQRETWFKIMEKNDWPRMAAVLIKLGVLQESARDLKLQVEFNEPDIIKSIDEEIKEDDHNFKHGLDSPVQKLMRMRGLSKDEALEIIAENKEDMSGGEEGSATDLLNQDPKARDAALAKLIGANNGQDKPGIDDDTTRPDRQRGETEATGSLDRREGLEERASSRDADSKRRR